MEDDSKIAIICISVCLVVCLGFLIFIMYMNNGVDLSGIDKNEGSINNLNNNIGDLSKEISNIDSNVDDLYYRINLVSDKQNDDSYDIEDLEDLEDDISVNKKLVRYIQDCAEDETSYDKFQDCILDY